MIDLKEKYIVDKKQRPVAVQIDIKTFRQIEEVLEDYALVQYMKQTDSEEKLTLEEAQSLYKKLPKK